MLGRPPSQRITRMVKEIDDLNRRHRHRLRGTRTSVKQVIIQVSRRHRVPSDYLERTYYRRKQVAGVIKPR